LAWLQTRQAAKRPLIPIRLAEGRLAVEHGPDHVGGEGSHGLGPGRVKPLGQRERPAGGDLGEGQPCDFSGTGRQVFRGESQVIFLLAVQGVDRARIECGEAAADEIIVDLGLDGLESGGGGRAAERENGIVIFGLLPPIGIGMGLGEERIGLGLGDARFAAAIRLGAQARNNVSDDRFGGGVILSRVRRHDAVPVETGLGKDLPGLERILDADDSRVRVAQAGEHSAGRGEELLAFRDGVVDGAEGKLGGASEQIAGVLEPPASPLHGLDNLGRPDTAIVVAIDERQRPGIEFQAGGGTSQSDPQLLVQLVQRHEIAACIEPDLIEAACSREFPSVA